MRSGYVAGLGAMVDAARVAVLIASLVVVTVTQTPSAAADEAALVRIEYGSELVVDAHVDRVRRDLVRRLVEVADAHRMSELWESAIVFTPNPTVDAYYMENSAGLTDARNIFYEGDYETSIGALERWLERFEGAPEILAAHPDLIPVTFECLLMIVRGYDALGDAESAEQAMERIVSLFRFATPSPYAFDEAFRDRVSQARRDYSARSLTVRWRSGSDCAVMINGSDAAVMTGAELLLPDAPQFLQLRCNEGDSMIYRIRDDVSSMDLDFDFDDTVRNIDGLPELWPRSSATPDLLSRLAHQAARTLDVEMVFTVGVTPDISHSPAALELSRWSTVESSFRAVRLPLELGTEDSDVEAAIHYLITGDVTGDFVVWQEYPGWVRVNRDGLVTEEDEATQTEVPAEVTDPTNEEIRIVIEAPTQPDAAPEARRPFSWFFLFPVAVAGGTYYAATRFESHRIEGEELLDECNRSDVTCTTPVYDDRRNTVENNELYRDLAYGTTALLGVTAVGLLIGLNMRRGPRATPTAWIDPGTGAFGASVDLRF